MYALLGRLEPLEEKITERSMDLDLRVERIETTHH